MATKNPIVTFNGGEVSPLLWGRSDQNKYRSWQKQCDNFIVEPQGALKRRQGTVIQSRIGDLDNFVDSIIEPWLIDRDNYFQMVFVNQEIRFFNPNGIQVFTLPIPYSPSDFDELYFRQVYRQMYVCHPSYPVKIIERTDQFVWEISDAVINGGPFASDNFDTNSTITIIDSGGGNASITSIDPIFEPTDVGRLIRAVHPNPIVASGNYSSNSASSPLKVGGLIVTMRSGGTWTGTLNLELSLDDGATWQTIGSISSKNNYNGEIIRDIVDFNAQVRVRTTDYVSGVIDWTLDTEGTFYNTYRITNYINANQVDVELVNAYEITPDYETWEWALGAFSETTGYPTCCEIFDERLFLAGVESYPADFYVSQTDVWENFLSGTLATSPFRFTLNSDVRNRTRWFLADQQLVAGTDNAEFTIGSRNSGQGISIENVTVSNQKQYGSEPIQPIRADSTSYFVEAGARRVRNLAYLFDTDSYMSDDMSILAPHLTKDNKITKIAHTRTPDKIVWCVRDDGLLLSFTTEQEQNVGAWAKHPLYRDNGGDVETVNDWEVETIGRVLDIDSVLTREGDILGLIIQRQDGVYYETLSPQGDCLDAVVVFEGITDEDVLALPGDEGFELFDQAFINTDIPFSGKGAFIRLDVPVNDLVIKYDGTILNLGVEYAQVREDLLYWVPLATDLNLIEVLDFTTPLTAGVDYYEVLSDDTFVVEVKPLDPDNISEYEILNSGLPYQINVDYFAMSGALQFLIIDPGTTNPEDITINIVLVDFVNLKNDDDDPVLNDDDANILVNVGGVNEPLSEDQYSVFTPRFLISIYPTQITTAYFGLRIYSQATLVDMYNTPGIGGGLGHNKRETSAAVLVVDSVNFQYSSNVMSPYDNWQVADFQQKNVQMDVKIPPFTGLIRINTPQGYADEANIGIRSDSPYCLVVAQIAPIGKDVSQKGR